MVNHGLASGMLLRLSAGGQQTLAAFVYRGVCLQGEVGLIDGDEERGPGLPGPLSCLDPVSGGRNLYVLM